MAVTSSVIAAWFTKVREFLHRDCARNQVEHSLVILLLLSGSSWGQVQDAKLQAALRTASLGDDVHSYHFFAISDYLRKNPGTEKQASEAQVAQTEIARSKEILKPPTASLCESEFSHLLLAIQQSKGLSGASVFNLHGLKVGASGLQIEPLVLDENVLREIKLRTLERPYVRPLSCEVVKNELVRNCSDPFFESSVSCSEIRKMAENCGSSLYAVYRSIYDFSDAEPVVVGISVVVFDQAFVDDSPQW